MTRVAIPFWPPIPPGAYLRRPVRRLPFPLEEPGCRIFRLGRHALWHGLRSLPLRPGEEVLVPAYHHGSEVEAMAAAGLRCRFYDATTDLSPDPQVLDRMLAPSVRALHLTHYLGFPQDAARWRRWCDDRGLLLIEDAAMGWPGRGPSGPLGSHGDVAIFSPWKAVGLRDTGAVLCRGRPPPAPAPPARLAPRALLGAHRAWLAQRLPAVARRPPAVGGFDPRDFELGDPDLAPARASCHLMRRLCRPEIVVRRRRNYEWLLERLGPLVPAPFRRLPPGAFPLAFPIACEDRGGARAQLAGSGIEAVALWSFPHRSLPVERFPEAARRRASWLALPVHQGLRPSELDAVAAAVETATSPARRRPAVRSAKPLARPRTPA